MVEMAVEKAEMVEDMYLDANSVDNMGIEFWNAENNSIDIFSDIKMSPNFKVPTQFHKPIISMVAYDPRRHQDTIPRRRRSPFARADLSAYLYFFIMNF